MTDTASRRDKKEMKHTNCRHKKLNFNFERGSCTLIAIIAACLGSVATARTQSAPLSLSFLVQQAMQRQRWPALSVVVKSRQAMSGPVKAQTVVVLPGDGAAMASLLLSSPKWAPDHRPSPCTPPLRSKTMSRTDAV